MKKIAEVNAASSLSPRLVRVMSALWTEPWLITPEMHKTICNIVEAHARGGDSEEAQHAVAAAMGKSESKRIFSVAGSTAVIPIEGVIGRKYADCLNSSGVVSIDIAERMMKAAADDPTIDSLCLVFDSPGGVAMGVPEVATTISGINERKPVMAFIDGLCCSAGYWLASQCSAIYAISSAEIGSIGAYMAFLDDSRQLTEAGLFVEMFKSGEHKAMGMPHQKRGARVSISDEQCAMFQKRIDELGNTFKAAVRSGRGRQISDDVMQGQSFSIEESLKHGLIDNVTDFAGVLRDAATLGKLRARK
jgi:signal peptide peptidase SppA